MELASARRIRNRTVRELASELAPLFSDVSAEWQGIRVNDCQVYVRSGRDGGVIWHAMTAGRAVQRGRRDTLPAALEDAVSYVCLEHGA